MNSYSSYGAEAKIQSLWMADPSGIMAFHFPRKILLTQAEVYFLLSFVLVSVIMTPQKKKKNSQESSEWGNIFITEDWIIQ